MIQSPKNHGSYCKSLETLAKKEGRLDEKWAAKFPDTLDNYCSALPFQDTNGLSHFVQPPLLIKETYLNTDQLSHKCGCCGFHICFLLIRSNF